MDKQTAMKIWEHAETAIRRHFKENPGTACPRDLVEISRLAREAHKGKAGVREATVRKIYEAARMKVDGYTFADIAEKLGESFTNDLHRRYKEHFNNAKSAAVILKQFDDVVEREATVMKIYADIAEKLGEGFTKDLQGRYKEHFKNAELDAVLLKQVE